MNPSDGNFYHYMDLVIDQELWGIFRKVDHYQDLATYYLLLRQFQKKTFPDRDPELESELNRIRLELRLIPFDTLANMTFGSACSPTLLGC
ncbi:MAG: hypothetical protein ACFB10_22830 [Salibacteraceae bacterium]